MRPIPPQPQPLRIVDVIIEIQTSHHPKTNAEHYHYTTCSGYSWNSFSENPFSIAVKFFCMPSNKMKPYQRDFVSAYEPKTVGCDDGC
jgi:hypothetical protein